MEAFSDAVGFTETPHGNDGLYEKAGQFALCDWVRGFQR